LCIDRAGTRVTEHLLQGLEGAAFIALCKTPGCLRTVDCASPESRRSRWNQRTEEALLNAYPVLADKVCAESVAEIAQPIRGNEHAYEGSLEERHHIHACMRLA